MSTDMQPLRSMTKASKDWYIQEETGLAGCWSGLNNREVVTHHKHLCDTKHGTE